MLAKAVRRLVVLLRLFVDDPGQLRYAPQWVATLGKSTLQTEMAWLPFRVLDRLSSHLSGGGTVFEFGGGGSTVWFVKQGAQVVTVEHDSSWHAALKGSVGQRPEVTLLHGSHHDQFAAYVRAIADYPDDHFDVVVVDGRERVRCFEAAMPKVKPGGLLILDDTDRTRYAGAFGAASGWPVKTYRGLTPSKTLLGVTSVWVRPVS